MMDVLLGGAVIFLIVWSIAGAIDRERTKKRIARDFERRCQVYLEQIADVCEQANGCIEEYNDAIAQMQNLLNVLGANNENRAD